MGRAGTAVDEERANLEVLNSNLSKTHDITSRMAKLLGGFDDRLEKMENSMKPIHRTTQRLKLMNINVDATLAAIQKTKEYWTIPGEEEPLLKAGPENDVEAYLGSIRRLDRGLVMLRATGDESSQKISQKIEQLLQLGTSQLRDSWRSIVAEKSVPIEPLAFVLKDQPFPAYTKNQISFLTATARFSSDEAHINDLKSSIERDFIELRSAYLQKSMHSFALASQRNLEIRTSSLYERENNGIGHYTEALLRLSQTEKSLCLVVFKEQDGLDIHNRVVASTFNDFFSAVKAITNHVRQRVSSDCYLGFETLENTARLFRVVQDIEMPEIARDLNTSFTNLASISGSAFYELSEDIKRRCNAISVVPFDGSVMDVTKELCARLRMFVEYPKIVLDLIAAVGDGGWRRPVSGTVKVTSADPGLATNLLDNWASEAVEALLQTLEQKARSLHKRLNLVGVFMLNNGSHIQIAIQRSEMGKFMSGRTISRIEDSNKKALKMYRESWDMSARQLMDTTIMRPQDKSSRNSLSSKDREAVKERFKLFNAEFDESIRACKSFAVSDPDLRQQLTSEIRSIIVPLYSRFYDKYISTDFTKHKDKYIKYTKESIEKTVWDSFS